MPDPILIAICIIYTVFGYGTAVLLEVLWAYVDELEKPHSSGPLSASAFCLILLTWPVWLIACGVLHVFDVAYDFIARRN